MVCRSSSRSYWSNILEALESVASSYTSCNGTGDAEGEGTRLAVMADDDKPESGDESGSAADAVLTETWLKAGQPVVEPTQPPELLISASMLRSGHTVSPKTLRRLAVISASEECSLGMR